MKTKFIFPTLFFLALLFTFVNSCKKDKSFIGKLGDKYQGGIILYILQPGDPGHNANAQHGVIVTPVIQSPDSKWSNVNGDIVTAATGTAIGTGKSNTEKIVAAQGVGNYAASICANLVLNGYDDWFLPSKDELYKLYLGSETLDNVATNDPEVNYFSGNPYWSSTEVSQSKGAAIDFFMGVHMDLNKSEIHKVRAIRYY